MTNDIDEENEIDDGTPDTRDLELDLLLHLGGNMDTANDWPTYSIKITAVEI